MATTGALPTLPNAIGGDTDAQKEYTGAISKVLESLQSRNQPNLWNVAGQFLNPGRTGNFGEALGNVAMSVGQDVQRQQEQEPSIAMMRAQLAGQKYEIGNQGKALNLLANTLGMDPTATTQAISNGTLPASAVSKITPEIYTTVSLLYPKLGETLKNAFGMDIDRAKLNVDVNKGVTDAAKIVLENGPGAIPYLSKQFTQNMPGQQAPASPSLNFKPPVEGSISSGFGTRKDPIDPNKTATHNGIDFSGTAGAPVVAVLPGVVKSAGTKGEYGNIVEVEHKDGTTSYYAHLAGINVKPGDKVEQGMPIGTIGSTGKSTGAHVEFGVRNASGKPIDPTSLFGQKPASESVQVATLGNEGLPLGKQTEVAKTRVLESDKPFQAKVDVITNYTPQVIGASNRNLDELDQLAGQYSRAFGLMKKQGLLSAIQAAANQGVTASAGQYSASLSLPVKAFLEKYRLSETEQDVVTRASQIIGEEFLNNVKTNKGLLGVNPTDNDARLLQAPMASLDDSAKAIQGWARRQTLVNNERGELFNALSQHRQRVGATAPPSTFFSSRDYQNVLDTYAPKYKALESQIGPLAKPQQ